MPPRRCGYCREEGHNRSICVKLQIDIVLNIHGRQSDLYNTQLPTFRISRLSLDRLAQVKLLIDGQLPYMIYKNENQTRNFLVRFENNILTVKNNEYITQEMKMNAKNAILENTETIINYKNDYQTRINHIKRTCKYREWNSINNTITIINGDYIEYARAVAQRDREAEVRYQQRVDEPRNANINVIDVTNRELLPIIRNTPIDAEDCPICLEPIGETAKSILRCGHQVCIDCLITQTLRSVATRNTSACICTICRATYL